MPDETTVALQEIASLLRRRVAQQDEMAERSQKDIAKMVERSEARGSGPNAHHKMREESKQRTSEMMAKMEQQSAKDRQEKERLQAEESQFRQQLLAELERHNALLERLLERMA